MHYYYSIYRKDYLYKGLVLYESMKIHDGDFKFFLVCMEEESVELLKKMNCIDLIPISIKEIEAFDSRIPELKCQRGEKTYIWTAKASVPLFLFDKYKEMDHVIWLDGDTEFLSNPEPIYREWGDNSVLLTPERFTGEYEYLGNLFGFYNTGFIGFKNDDIGISALYYFKERLQEWKNSIEEQSSWNDQLYVNDWTERFQKVGVSQHDGINLTPFIASRINAEQNGFVNMKGYVPHIKDTPIVLYHFMALKYYDGNEFDLCNYWMKIDKQTIEKLYLPYFDKCNHAYKRIRDIDSDFYPYLSLEGKYVGNYFNNNIKKMESTYDICTITWSNQIVQTLSLYQSIKKYNQKFRLWICCNDVSSYKKFSAMNLPEVHLFQPANLIENYDQVLQSSVNVSLEVLKPRFMHLVLLNNYNIENLLYVDSKCYFHQSPKNIFDILNENSITLFESGSNVENNFGISNSVIGFHRDSTALECLFYWVEQTKEWLKCGVNSDEEFQYISKWAQKDNKVTIQRSPSYLLDDAKLRTVNIKVSNDKIYANNDLLILYQYNIENVNDTSFNHLVDEIFKATPIKRKHIYLQYLKSIRNSIDQLWKVKS